MKYVIFFIMFILLVAVPVWADFSEKESHNLSEQMMADITKAYGCPKEPSDNAPVSQIFKNLVKHTHRKDIKYRLKVAESKQINAYAMPDGRIVFLSELIKVLPIDDQAPLAWVAAHEISHVELHHAERKLTNSLTTGIALFLIVGKSNSFVKTLGAISQGFLTSGYSRVMEYEADKNALLLMKEAGYDPNGALVTMNLFQNLENKRRGLRIFPSHPMAGDRAKSVVAWMHSNGLAVSYRGTQDEQSLTPLPVQPANNMYIDLTLRKPRLLNLPQSEAKTAQQQIQDKTPEIIRPENGQTKPVVPVPVQSTINMYIDLTLEKPQLLPLPQPPIADSDKHR